MKQAKNGRRTGKRDCALESTTKFKFNVRGLVAAAQAELGGDLTSKKQKKKTHLHTLALTPTLHVLEILRAYVYLIVYMYLLVQQKHLQVDRAQLTARHLSAARPCLRFFVAKMLEK